MTAEPQKRLTIGQIRRRIVSARWRLAQLDERIGQLMSTRVEEENALAELLKQERDYSEDFKSVPALDPWRAG